MGVQDIMFGYIEEADPGRGGGLEESKLKHILSNDMRKHNKAIIDALPIDDKWPPLSCKMFNFIPNDHLLTYKNSIILFGGSFKSIYLEWPEWLDKFEGVLKQMYWESVVVTLNPGIMATHHFSWKPKHDWVSKMCNRQLEKITEWDFEGIRQF